MNPGIDLLANLPQLAAIGRPKLAAYVADWLATPLAHEFAVTAIDLTENLQFNPTINIRHWLDDGETVIVPFDEMLHYIVDRHFEDIAQRKALHARIDQLRRENGNAGRFFHADVGPAYPLYLVCKNSACHNLMRTQHMAHVGQRVTGNSANVTCPQCQQNYLYSPDDLQFLASPG